MSDNRKYYYLKLKENYFDEDAIVLLESMQDGMAMGEQTRPIDRTKIIKKIGMVSDDDLFDEIVRASEAIVKDYR